MCHLVTSAEICSFEWLRHCDRKRRLRVRSRNGNAFTARLVYRRAFFSSRMLLSSPLFAGICVRLYLSVEWRHVHLEMTSRLIVREIKNEYSRTNTWSWLSFPVVGSYFITILSFFLLSIWKTGALVYNLKIVVSFFQDMCFVAFPRRWRTFLAPYSLVTFCGILTPFFAY